MANAGVKWRRVEVDSDALLVDREGDWGGFLELEEMVPGGLNRRGEVGTVEGRNGGAGQESGGLRSGLFPGSGGKLSGTGTSKGKGRKGNGKREADRVSETKAWRKVEVDQDALLSTAEDDWGGFLQLEELVGGTQADIVDEGKGTAVPAPEQGSSKSEPKKKKRGRTKLEAEDRNDPAGSPVDCPPEPSSEVSTEAWKPFGLHKKLLSSLRRLAYHQPTPIQSESLRASLDGRHDVIGAAQTGSGKTLAFMLPIVHKLLLERDVQPPPGPAGANTSNPDGKNKRRGRLRALVVSPTRELALQIKRHVDAVAKAHGVHTAVVVGGMSHQKQERVLRYGPEIVVATPGRLWELISENAPHIGDLSSLSFFVLDEADRMVEQGHFGELDAILGRVPFSEKLQTFVFSATLTSDAVLLGRKARAKEQKKGKAKGAPGSVSSIMHKVKLRKSVKTFDLTVGRRTANRLEESVVHCSDESRVEFLYLILATTEGKTLVFCNAIGTIRTVHALLQLLGLPVIAIHAQQQQRQRLKALDSFRQGKRSILLATDVAARGLDIPGVRCVIQFHLPDSVDTYVHRAGRTARVEDDGLNILFVSPKDSKHYVKLRHSLHAGREVADYPLDHALMPQAHARVALARRIEAASGGDRRARSKQDWLRRNAEAAGIILDEDASDEEERGSRAKRQQCELRRLESELVDLLAKPLQRGFSNRYVSAATSTGESSVELARAAQKMRRRVRGSLTSKKRKLDLAQMGSHSRQGPEALHKLAAK